LITYPPSIKTDVDKLRAIYALLERHRMEHNRVGNIFLSNQAKFNDSWAAYVRASFALQRQLLKEQDALKETIMKANYTEKKWERLTLDEKANASKAIFGDEEAVKMEMQLGDMSRLTGVSCPVLDEIMSLSSKTGME
jgi:hypothetical protein